MTSITIFGTSGLVIILLLITKWLGIKRRKHFFFLNLISKKDPHIRYIYHKVVHSYSHGKEKITFFFERQIRIHSKNLLNKASSHLIEQRNKYIGNMRDSRLLRKSSGISEFFKTMSNVEKGNGEVHDTYRDASQNESTEPGSQETGKEVK